MKKRIKDVEHSNDTGQMGKDIGRNAVEDFLELANDGEHGKDGFNDHALIPGSFLAKLEMFRSTVGVAEAQVSQGDGLVLEGSSKAVEVLVGMVQGVEIPLDQASVSVEHDPKSSANHPPTLVTPFLADLPLAAPLPNGKQQLDGIAIHHGKRARLRQKQVQPFLVYCQAPLQACPVWQAAEQAVIVSFQPAVECSKVSAFQRKQDAYR